MWRATLASHVSKESGCCTCKPGRFHKRQGLRWKMSLMLGPLTNIKHNNFFRSLIKPFYLRKKTKQVLWLQTPRISLARAIISISNKIKSYFKYYSSNCYNHQGVKVGSLAKKKKKKSQSQKQDRHEKMKWAVWKRTGEQCPLWSLVFRRNMWHLPLLGVIKILRASCIDFKGARKESD